MRIISILFLASPIIFLMSVFIFAWWYKKNYITHESTESYSKGWHKCWYCKKCEHTMFFKNTYFGRIYKCSDCFRNIKKINF